MKVTITSLTLKRWYLFFPFSWAAMKVVMQIKKSPAKQFLSNGLGLTHFTLSLWENEADLKSFARSGAHLEAMKKSARFASEIRTYTYDSDKLPEWETAKRLLATEGKSIKF